MCDTPSHAIFKEFRVFIKIIVSKRPVKFTEVQCANSLK